MYGPDILRNLSIPSLVNTSANTFGVLTAAFVFGVIACILAEKRRAGYLNETTPAQVKDWLLAYSRRAKVTRENDQQQRGVSILFNRRLPPLKT